MSNERASRTILGERLKEEREYRGFSQEQITRYLGMPPTVLSQIESGSRDIRPQDLRRLANLFRIRIESLTGHSPEAAETESLPLPARADALSPTDRDELRRFARHLRSLTSNDQK